MNNSAWAALAVRISGADKLSLADRMRLLVDVQWQATRDICDVLEIAAEADEATAEEEEATA